MIECSTSSVLLPMVIEHFQEFFQQCLLLLFRKKWLIHANFYIFTLFQRQKEYVLRVFNRLVIITVTIQPSLLFSHDCLTLIYNNPMDLINNNI